MDQTAESNNVKGDSSNVVALSSDIAWLKDAEGGWQFGEAGVIHELTKRIECNKHAVEFGGGDQLQKLTVQRLVQDGWNALLIEGDENNFKQLKATVADFEKVKVLNQFIDPVGEHTLENTLKNSGFETPDVLVIDIDSEDYYALASCDKIKAKILCVEHHDTLDPKMDHTKPVVPDGEQLGKLIDGFNAQANAAAIEELAVSMGYKRVWHGRVNSVFVLAELYDSLVERPASVANKFEYDTLGKKREWQKIDNPKVSLILSQPRLCFTDHSDRLINLAARLKFNTFRSSGAFWDRDIECTTMTAIHADQPDFLLYSDYDSVFDPDDVAKLLEAINNDPAMAAIGAVQMSRHDDKPLVFEAERDYSEPLTRVEYQHFGLTLIRRQVFEELPHPWFWSTPGVRPDGTVGWDVVNRSDADITFWRLLRNANMKVVQHNEVVIGHMILAVKWPKNTGYGVQLQPIENYNRQGKPANATMNQDIFKERLKQEAERRAAATNG